MEIDSGKLTRNIVMAMLIGIVVGVIFSYMPRDSAAHVYLVGGVFKVVGAIL